MNVAAWLVGKKTYIAALGLLGLAIYQASTGEYQAAVQSVIAALAAAGLRNAITTASIPKP